VAQHGAHIRIVIPPHVTAVLSDEAGVNGHSQRDGHIALIEAKGRLEWQKATGYGRRSLAETTMGDTNGLLARNFGQGPLQVNRPKPPSASRF
jgi:hypothetical protein